MGWQRRASGYAVLALAAGSLAALAPVAAPGSPIRTPAVGSASGDPAAEPPTSPVLPAAPSPAAATTHRSEPSSPPEGREAVLEVYRRRSSALAAGDRSAWESTVADPSSDAGREQLVAYDNLRALGVTELSVRDVESAAQPVSSSSVDDLAMHGAPPMPQDSGPPPSLVTVVVSLGHRIPGFDRAPRYARRTLTLEPRPGGWRVARDGSSADPLQVWDLPGLRVRRSDTALVAGDADAGVLAQRLADAEAGQAQVREVLATSVPAVLVVPATAQEAARQLGRPEGFALAQLAASTDGAAQAAADRVVLDPDAFAALTPRGRQVVVAHELTHVTVRASTPGRVPLWLSEGLAEHVAWKPVQMPVQTAAARLLGRVRSAGAPAAFPGDSQFDPARSDVASAYQAAWLAVRHLAQTHGEERLLAFYRAVAGTSGAAGMEQAVERAFVAELGTTSARAEQEWRSLLEQLAR